MPRVTWAQWGWDLVGTAKGRTITGTVDQVGWGVGAGAVSGRGLPFRRSDASCSDVFCGYYVCSMMSNLLCVVSVTYFFSTALHGCQKHYLTFPYAKHTVPQAEAWESTLWILHVGYREKGYPKQNPENDCLDFVKIETS